MLLYFREGENYSPTQFWPWQNHFFQLTVNFLCVSAIPTIHSFYCKQCCQRWSQHKSHNANANATHLVGKYFCKEELTKTALIFFFLCLHYSAKWITFLWKINIISTCDLSLMNLKQLGSVSQEVGLCCKSPTGGLDPFPNIPDATEPT